MQWAVGEVVPEKVALPARLMGRLVKPMVFRNENPLRKNSPAATGLIVADERVFLQAWLVFAAPTVCYSLPKAPPKVGRHSLAGWGPSPKHRMISGLVLKSLYNMSSSARVTEIVWRE